MKFIRYFIFVWLTLIASNCFGQQNLIKNGSFEEKAFGVQNDKPDNVHQLSKCKHWKDDRNSDFNTHSPDWHRDDANYHHTFFDNQVIQANTGDHYVGMLHGEVIEQRVGNLEPDKAYKLVFYVRLTSDMNSKKVGEAPRNAQAYYTNNYPNAKISILLSNKKIEYEHYYTYGYACNANAIQRAEWYEKTNPVTTVASIPIDITTYPSDRWHRVETYLSRPLYNEGLKWIGFELVHDRHGSKLDLGWGELCEIPYIFIDDVELYEVDCQECLNCSFKDGCINIQTQSNPQSGNCVEFTNLHNVTTLKIEIFNGGGQLVRTYDLNYPPSTFAWDGKNNFGGNVDGGTFYAKVTASNDCNSTSSTFSLVVPDGNWTCSGITNPVSGDRPPDG